MMVISCHLVIEFALETWIRRMTGSTATLKTVNRHVFYKLRGRSAYYFLLFFHPKLTNSCLAMLASLQTCLVQVLIN